MSCVSEAVLAQHLVVGSCLRKLQAPDLAKAMWQRCSSTSWFSRCWLCQPFVACRHSYWVLDVVQVMSTRECMALSICESHGICHVCHYVQPP
jgi:hypothetical protein